MISQLFYYDIHFVFTLPFVFQIGRIQLTLSIESEFKLKPESAEKTQMSFYNKDIDMSSEK